MTSRRTQPQRVRLTVALAVLGALCGTVHRTALAQNDVLVLRNGDWMTGTLMSVAGGTWTFRHAGGDLKLPADQVAEFTGAAPMGRRLADGGIAAGRLTSDGVGFRIGSRNRYNNRPPTGIEKHDWLLTFNLTYAIGD